MPPLVERKLLYVICKSARPDDIKAAAVQFVQQYNRPPELLRMTERAQTSEYLPNLPEPSAKVTLDGTEITNDKNTFCGIPVKLWPTGGAEFWTVLSCYQ